MLLFTTIDQHLANQPHFQAWRHFNTIFNQFCLYVLKIVVSVNVFTENIH